MITITDKAEKHFSELLASQPLQTGLELWQSVDANGTVKRGLSFLSRVSDRLVQYEAARVGSLTLYISKKDWPVLQDTQISVIEDAFGYRVCIVVPAVEGLDVASGPAPGLEERVRRFIEQEINPALAMHGGAAALAAITPDGIACVTLLGGCSGCAMAKLTVKAGIESALQSNFPEIKGVKDVTQHQRGDHSYY